MKYHCCKYQRSRPNNSRAEVTSVPVCHHQRLQHCRGCPLAGPADGQSRSALLSTGGCSRDRRAAMQRVLVLQHSSWGFPAKTVLSAVGLSLCWPIKTPCWNLLLNYIFSHLDNNTGILHVGQQCNSLLLFDYCF